MRELSLFTGIGGGLIASRLLGWQTVCAVEINEYCCKVLMARQEDGLLDQFPIWNDIKTLPLSSLWNHTNVDVVSGGFPCQHFSHAARGRNNAEDLWPEMLRVITSIKSPYVFAENVTRKAISIAADDLYRIGYSCRYMCLSAADLGAPHQRDRYWLAAHTDPDCQPRCPEHVETPGPSALSIMEWWQNDSRAMGVYHGLSPRVDQSRATDRQRLQGLGNAQVPAVAVMAWKILSETL